MKSLSHCWDPSKTGQNFILVNGHHVITTLVRNENIKRPGFYVLPVTGVFSNFPKLKQLSKMKNKCKYCDLHEL